MPETPAPHLTAPSIGAVLQHGELFLTLPQFHQLLKQSQIPCSRASLYRWLNVTKQFLPARVQQLLAPAPLVWFVEVPRLNQSNKPISVVVPLRYLAADRHSAATPLALHFLGYHSLMDRLARLRTMTSHITREIEGLEEYLTALHPEDAHDYRPHAHTITA